MTMKYIALREVSSSGRCKDILVAFGPGAIIGAKEVNEGQCRLIGEGPFAGVVVTSNTTTIQNILAGV